MTTTKIQSTDLLKATDVAKRLNISKSLAYRLMQRGKIPTVQIEGSVRVRPCDLDEFITQNWTGRDEQSAIF